MRGGTFRVDATAGGDNLRTDPAKRIQRLDNFQFASRERPQIRVVGTTIHGIARGTIDNAIDAGEVGMGQTSSFRLGQLTLREAYFRLSFGDIRAKGEGTFQTLFERQALAWSGCDSLQRPHQEEDRGRNRARTDSAASVVAILVSSLFSSPT